MALQRYTNNANTTLASSISAAATSLSVSAGTGALFPTLNGTTQWFMATLSKASNPTILEIVRVTARSGDSFTTIVRAQEGTTALAWNSGDNVELLPTQGGFYNFVQFDDLQAAAGEFALDTGTANAYAVNLTPPLTAHLEGAPIYWLAGHTNTGNSTFNDGVGTAALLTPEGNNILPGQISAGGIYVSAWDGSHFQLITVHGISFSQLIGSIANGQVPLSAVLQYVANILANAALTGTPTAPTAATNTSTTQVATTAFVNPGTVVGIDGYRKNPDGTIDQWGVVAFSGSGGLSITFNIPWPNTMFSMNINGQISGFQPGISAFSKTSVSLEMSQMQGTAQSFYWRAIGH